MATAEVWRVSRRLRERLEIRIQALADVQDEDEVLDCLRFGLPTPGIITATLSELLAAAPRSGTWLITGRKRRNVMLSSGPV